MVFVAVNGNVNVVGAGEQLLESGAEAGLSFIKLNYTGLNSRKGNDPWMRGVQFARLYEDGRGYLKYELTLNRKGEPSASADKVWFQQDGIRKNRMAYIVDTPYNRERLAKGYHTELNIKVADGKINSEIKEIADKKYPFVPLEKVKPIGTEEFLDKLAEKKAGLTERNKSDLRSKARKVIEQKRPELVAMVKSKCDNPDKYYLTEAYKKEIVPLLDSEIDRILMEGN